MADHKNDHLMAVGSASSVLSKRAADSLKGLDKANHDIKQCAIAVA